MHTIIAKTLLTTAASAALALTALPGVASAGEVANRFADQQARINQGVASGQLTGREYGRDEARLDRVEAQRDRDLAAQGGRLTPGERAHFNRELNRNSSDIYFTKHNLSHQPGAPTI